MKIIQGALNLFALTSSVEAGRDGKPRGKLSHKKRLASRSPLKINPAASNALARSATVSAHASRAKVGAEAVDAPMIDGYTFRGVGCCENDE